MIAVKSFFEEELSAGYLLNSKRW